jgi:SAM-dependent methyltransferase
MDDRRIAVIYQEYVVAHDLERSALLEALRARCTGEATVLYPGAFVHVTPSFFFQHVVYVDRSDFSRDFFARAQAVLDVVNQHKQYRQRPFIRFVRQDFTADLPVPEGSFDLLLALYAGGVSQACARYVKSGGLLLTNDHHGDARDAARLPEFELRAVVEERRGEVRFDEKDLERYTLTGGPTRPRQQSEFRPDYYLFRRRPRTWRTPSSSAPG